MTVFVTGGSGVVGRSLIARLVSDGHVVRALARSSVASTCVRSLGAEPVVGDLNDMSTLVHAMKGASCVFHVAGVNELCVGDPSDMYTTNVDGTRNVVRAANSAEVPRMVHTSSAVTLGERQGEVGNELSTHRGFVLSHYEKSKTLAEQVVFAEAGYTEVVAVNPSSVQGPGRATGTGKLILDVINGDLRFMVDAGLSIVDIDDCIEGHILAWNRGVPGKRYVLSGFSMTTKAAIVMLEGVIDRELSVRYVPATAAAIGGGLAELAGRMRKGNPRVCREMVRVMRHGHVYDGSLATRELGLVYSSPLDTFKRLVGWFRSEDLLH